MSVESNEAFERKTFGEFTPTLCESCGIVLNEHNTSDAIECHMCCFSRARKKDGIIATHFGEAST